MKHNLRFAMVSLLVSCAAFVSPQDLSPGDEKAFKEHMSAANEARDAGRSRDAIEEYKKANKLRKNKCGECYLGAALVYAKMNQAGPVLENSDLALRYVADSRYQALAHKLKGDALSATAGTDAKKLASAEREYRDAIGLDPQNSMAHYNLGILLLREASEPQGKAELEQYLTLMPNGAQAKQARRILANPRLAREPLAPDFQMQTMQGETLSLEGLAGKIVVFDFWATWCPPCVRSVPDVQALYRKYPHDKLTIISVSADGDEKKWRDFVAKKSMEWPQVWDSSGNLRASFGVRAFPTYLVVDGDGVIRDRITGENPQESVVHRLKDVLAEVPQLKNQK